MALSDPEMRLALRQHSSLLRREVTRILRRVPANVSPDDLYSAARVGLWQGLTSARAVSSDDDEFRHRAYLITRIRGAILDELRAQDWLSRRERRKQRATRVVELDEAPDQAAPSEEEQMTARITVNKALELIGPRERFILASVYMQGMSMKDVSVVLGVSQPRVSQLHTRALEQLRDLLDADAA